MFDEELSTPDEIQPEERDWEEAAYTFDEVMAGEEEPVWDEAVPAEQWEEEEPGEPVVALGGELVPLSELMQEAQEQEDLPGAEQVFVPEAEKLSAYGALWERYPHLKDPREMPIEVLRAVRDGVQPLVAYQDVLLGQHEMEKQALLHREAVALRSPGSAAGFGDEDSDDMFDLFDAVIDGRIY